MFNVIIFGPPGSGKGTQSKRVALKYNLEHISTGDIFRTEIHKATRLGMQAKNFLDQGILVPDELVLKKLYVLLNRLENSKGLIFDGFPRTLTQAQTLDNYLAKFNSQVQLAISMVVTLPELYRRMIKRGRDSGRSDDKKPIIERRLAIAQQHTRHLVEYYAKQQKLICISGMSPVEEVSERICRSIDLYLEKNKIYL